MTVYEYNYILGKQHKENGRQCLPPFTLPEINAFRGYMDGYSGNEFREPSPILLLDKIKKNGIESIKEE
jgi:hypothetical protein